MDKNIDKEKILLEALSMMNPKIKKSLLNTCRSERDDLEQEIKLKVINAVLIGKIKTPPTFSEFKKKFNKMI